MNAPLSLRPLAIFGTACLVSIWTIMDPVFVMLCGRVSCGVGSFAGGLQVLVLCLLTLGFHISQRRMKIWKFSVYIVAWTILEPSILFSRHFWHWPPICRGLQIFMSFGLDCHERSKSSTLWVIVLRSSYASSHRSSDRFPTVIFCWIKQVILANSSMIKAWASSMVGVGFGLANVCLLMRHDVSDFGVIPIVMLLRNGYD